MNQIAPHQPQPIATASHWAHFLRPIAASVRNPPGETDFKAKVAAALTAFPDCPAAILAKPWLQAEAMRKFQFWPAIADLAELLAPEITDTRRQSAEAAALPYVPPQMRLAPSTEAVQAVQAKVAAYLAETQAEATQRASAGRAAPLSDGALLVAYEAAAAQGNQAAATRAASLRRKLGA